MVCTLLQAQPSRKEKFIENLSKEFNYSFPDIFSSEIEDVSYDTSELTAEELDFLQNYTGSYISREDLSYSELNRKFYEVYLSSIEYGIKFYRKGYSKYNVVRNGAGNTFSVLYTHDMENIEDIKKIKRTLKLENRVQKGPDGKDAVELFVEKKSKLSGLIKKHTAEEDEIRTLLTGFFTELADENYAAAREYLKSDSFIDYQNNKRIRKYTEKDIDSVVTSLGSDIWDMSGIEVYVDVYFSEDPLFIAKQFGKCIFVEFRSGPLDYCSFVLKKTGNSYKIAGYRHEFLQA